MSEFTKEDITHARNLLKGVYKMRGSSELDGLEMVAFGAACLWLKRLLEVMVNPPQPPAIPNPNDDSFKIVQVIKSEESMHSGDI